MHRLKYFLEMHRLKYFSGNASFKILFWKLNATETLEIREMSIFSGFLLQNQQFSEDCRYCFQEA